MDAVRRRGGGAGLALLLVGCLATSPALARSRRAAGDRRSPGSELRVYLMTMGPGEQVWERFGHNAIWIRRSGRRAPTSPTTTGCSTSGRKTSCSASSAGQMWYWMAGFPAEPYVQTYVRDNRSVWLQELNLPPRARLELREFLEWNERPENRFYHYDYYRDNCSTRVRDAIDRVIGGRDRRRRPPTLPPERPTASTPSASPRTIRRSSPVFSSRSGQRVDRPISAVGGDVPARSRSAITSAR